VAARVEAGANRRCATRLAGSRRRLPASAADRRSADELPVRGCAREYTGLESISWLTSLPFPAALARPPQLPAATATETSFRPRARC
jgi:hypothetical protein